MIEPADATYREAITRDLDTSMLVEAGAGSGKTTSLISRMLALIASGKAHGRNMIAVTFTRKAAAELKGRFQIALEAAARDEESAGMRQRYLDALSNLDLLFTGTIHAFCARLLRERPVESGIDPDFTELEDEENGLLRSRCWSEYMESLHTLDDEHLKALSDLGVDPARLVGAYENLCLYPEVEIARERIERPDFSRERSLLAEYLSQAWAALPGAVPPDDWDALQNLLKRTQRLCRHLDLSEDKSFIVVLDALNRSPQLTQNRWSDPATAKQQREAHARFRDEIVVPAIEKWHRYCHYFIMELVVPATRYFDTIRHESSQMNYQDLLIKAAELLRNNGEVRAYFQKRFTHVLVDEFQDTDPIQAEVILYLACDDPRETSWRRVRVRPGALFVVGDPKQSIYRFRRADIDTYNEVKRIVARSGGSVLPLTVNFRSVPALCDWINPIFTGKFPPEADRFQAGFERLVPYSAQEAGGVRCVSIEKQKNNRQADVAARDAERIASWIAWALQGNFAVLEGHEAKRPARPEDFMILLRYRRHISLYARALEVRRIPYEVAGGAGFGRSKEVGHLLTLLAAVAEPDDQVALVGALRGPFFGVSDDLLYLYRKGGGHFSYLSQGGRCSDEEARILIEGIFGEFAEFHHWSRTQAPATVLSRIMDRLGIIPLAAVLEMGETRAGNLLKVLELADSLSRKGNHSFAEVMSGIRQYFEEIETEEMSAEPGRTQVVRIMNLHKAKGLEAPVVFLADPLKDTDHGPEVHIDRLGDKAVGYFVATEPSGRRGSTVIGLPPDWAAKKDLEERYGEAEEERLLYVAATRAKQLLVVSRYPSSAGKGAWIELEPYLAGVGELEAPDVDVEARRPGVVSRAGFEEAKSRREASLAGGRLPSYAVESVTGIVEAESEMGPFAETGVAGRKMGSAIHRALEMLVRDESIDLDALTQSALRQEDLPMDKKGAVMTMLETVLSSHLWRRMRNAGGGLAEVPFAVRTEEAPLRVVSGKIDMVFKEQDGWVIVDFKSDRVDGNLDELVAYYSRQIGMYREFWERISGEAVKEAGVYFLSPGRWVTI